MTKLLRTFFFVCLLAFSAIANAQEWIEVSRTDKTLFFIKSDSVELSENDGGTKIVASVGRVISLTGNRTDIVIWYVTISNCIAGRGTLYVLNTNGKVIHKPEFVFQDKKVSSNIAEIMCRVVEDSYIKRLDLRKST
jgi:hypothetical protein